MASIELWMSKITGFMVLVRSHQRLRKYTASLRSELQELKNAISMPAETTETRPWQKTMDFVDGLKAKLPDEELTVIKRYVEKRSREAAQAQVTVTPVVTLQHSSPCPLNPDMPPDVCFKLGSNKGKMDPELKEFESSSAGTCLETPGQQCLPNKGTWETGRTTADCFLTAGVGSNQGETFLHQRNTLVRELGELRHRKNAGTRQLAKRTSSLTLVEKEGRHRFGTRL